MNLIYKGHVYRYSATVRTTLPSQTINWRYQVLGMSSPETTAVKHYSQPQAINWRYQVPEMA